ncbi:hypothetical protein BZG36_00002 [Bifiguratus adelaidae]|uniref:PPPDE domain-containing protein n=1 Tax=Bifiguratus adelaidae TaxID=1938954 RepID=A0A261Y875_9FUNG|nr:hypothetical protein BZG36_00002 [Bifiguratus adelaidae]
MASVQLYVYDLSQGMARQLSMGLTGRQIDGIWHTSVVAFDMEVFFGQGIHITAPGQSHHGTPVEKVDMGETFIPQEVFLDADKYHLLDNNCNTFTNDVCQFLTGRTIPAHITGLPSEFMNTVLGQSLRPMIDSMFMPQNIPDRTASQLSAAPAPVQNRVAPHTGNTGSTLQYPSTSSSLDQLIANNKAVAVMFTSATCPPCRVIAPEYESMIADISSGDHKVVGAKVDVGTAMGIGQSYNVRVTPTFMFFHDGRKLSEFKGADRRQLQSEIEFLVYTAYPPHPHLRQTHLRLIAELPTKPILFAKHGDLIRITGKVKDLLAKNPEAAKIIEDTHGILVSEDQTSTSTPHASHLAILARWSAILDEALSSVPSTDQFPILDLVRLVLLRPSGYTYYGQHPDKLLAFFSAAAETDMSKPSVLMTLRIAANIFANPSLQSRFITAEHSSERSVMTSLVVKYLLSSDGQIRQTASSIAYNMATWVAQGRRRSGTSHVEDEDWQVELVSAVIGALGQEQEAEVVHRLVSTLCHFIYLSPIDPPSPLPELVQVLGLHGILDDKVKALSSQEQDRCLKLSRELQRLIE